MTPSFATSLDALGGWRAALGERLEALARFLGEQELAHGEAAEQIAALRERLGNDKLVVAFVAEFSRGKSELINAIFFADTGRRILPATPGRTTMCPVELGWRGDEPASLLLLPIETRLEGLSLAEMRAQPRAWRRLALDVRDADQLAQSLLEVTRTEWVSEEQARALGFWDDATPDDNPPRDDDGQRRGARVAPRADQLPAPAPEAGPGRARHAGPERDRRRARADAEPAAERARDGLHPRRRHRRHQVRPGDLARSPRRDTRRRASSSSTRSTRSRIRWRRSSRSRRRSRSSSARPRARSACRSSACSRSRRVQALAARVRGDDMALNESRLPLLEAALGAQLLPQRRQVLEQVVQEGGAADRELRRAASSATSAASSPSRRSSCAACAARTAPRSA